MKRHGRTLNRLLMALVFLFLYAPMYQGSNKLNLLAADMDQR